MTNYKTSYFSTRSEWRRWLQRNFSEEKEIWLVFPGKSTGKERISYNDAVEEALCFGWIDSTVRSFDKDYIIQRFTPRNPGSRYSQPNKERLQWLMNKQLIHPSLVAEMKNHISEEFVFPADIIDALKLDERVWKNYTAFTDSYKRIRIAYIAGARKRPDEFKRRLSSFIRKTRENKLIKGHGGIEKYY